ncbi:MAG: hypothetical protein ACRDQ2_18745 [Gaiellales bacterium]
MAAPADAFGLAAELVDDIELSRLPVPALVMKVSRLARLVDDDYAQEWLSMEMRGLSDTDVGRMIMSQTGRWLNHKERKGYWQGVVEIEAQIQTQTALLSSLRIPDLSGDSIFPTLKAAREHAAAVAQGLQKLAGIRAKVLSVIHEFVATRYYELAFAERQAELFDEARQQVDALLTPLSGDTLSKIDSIYRRLAEDEPEAISHALTTCRRLIDAVADAIYPPSEATIDLGEGPMKLTQQQVQNRLNAFVAERTDSTSRRKKLRRTLGDLYGRASSGVHKDVSRDEARFIFLATYIYLGEVLSLERSSQPTVDDRG